MNASPSRKAWKTLYRLLRVGRRETEKAAFDCLIYGSGYIRFPTDGSDPKHIPRRDIK